MGPTLRTCVQDTKCACGVPQVVEIEDLKQVVTDKLGCGPNFKVGSGLRTGTAAERA